MEEKKIIQLKQGLTTAFINYSHASNLAYKPQFISNNYKEGRKVISSVEDELLNCEEFAISVAFITMGGITPLLQTLRELKYRGVRGKILTTDYLTFSEPEALRKLAQFENLELKMFVTENRKEGFHTKGYIFKKEEIYRIIVGSSNMTSSALTTNREWNTKIVSTEQGEYTHNVVEEFDQLWNSEQVLPFEEFIERYTDTYTRNKVIQKQKKLARETEIPSLEVYRLQPNSMQVGFINNLQKIYEAGENRALLISATGTGKTYASAFAMRELGFQRVLFLVHRNQIAKQAMKSYRKVFGGQVVMGMVTGKHQKYDADFVFATIQTLSKDEILEKYGKTAFDAIVIDEAHHSAANSYKKVMDYFHPKLWLGMTATPDKRDDNLDGRNIYEIFNHQIAYEIRLQDAMEEDLLCPFHYFGITDLEVIADAGKSKQDKIENFQYLTSDERALNVMKQAEFFGYSGERVKGLIFCSRIDEARILSEKFNSKGWRTLVLSGNDSEETRVEAIERLAGDEREDAFSNRNRQKLRYNYGREYGKNDKGWNLPEQKPQDNLELAYAISVHKSQGSEFDYVYIVIPKRDSHLLSMELLYTAITRAQKKVTIFLQEDIGTLSSLGHIEKSAVRRINSSVFKFVPLPEELLYIQNWYADEKKLATLSKYFVRSKSEVIIANMLVQEEVPFVYEEPLFAPDGTMFLPDFTVKFRGETYYWEHVGRLDLPDYRAHWEIKEKWYEKHFPGKLLTTFEGKDLSTDAMGIIKDHK